MLVGGDPPGTHGDAVLVGYQPPLAVLEAPNEGAGIVVLDVARASAVDVGARVSRIVQAQQGGLLFVVAVGDAEGLDEALVKADGDARDPRRVGVYHLSGAGRMTRVAGRALRLLDGAARGLAQAKPLALTDIGELLARGKSDREEEIHFRAQLHGRRPLATMALIGVCLGLYALATQWGGSESPLVALAMGANAADAVKAGQLWRLLGSAFLHHGSTHLMVNMIGLWSFGSFLEAVMGWRRYLVVYGVSALVGSLASAFIGNAGLSVGASGALWGLMLAGFALARPGQKLLPTRLARQLRQRSLVMLLLNVALSFIPGIDKYAHFGGGLAGFALVASGLLAPPAVGGGVEDPFRLRLAAALTAAAMAASIALALFTGRPWESRPEAPEMAVVAKEPR